MAASLERTCVCGLRHKPSQTVKAVTFLFLWIINSTFTNVWGKFVFWQTFHRKSTRSATLTSSVLFAPFFMLIWIQLYRKDRGGDSDPQPLFLCHVVCGFPSRSLTPNFNTLTNEQEWWHEPRRHTNKHFVLLLKLISLPWLADQAWRMWCVSKDGSLLSLN